MVHRLHRLLITLASQHPLPSSRHLPSRPPVLPRPAVRAPEQLGRQHAHGGRHHHDPRRRRGPAPAAPPGAHPGADGLGPWRAGWRLGIVLLASDLPPALPAAVRYCCLPSSSPTCTPGPPHLLQQPTLLSLSALPPSLQVVIVPIIKKEADAEGVMAAVQGLERALKAAGVRVLLDATTGAAGWGAACAWRAAERRRSCAGGIIKRCGWSAPRTPLHALSMLHPPACLQTRPPAGSSTSTR